MSLDVTVFTTDTDAEALEFADVDFVSWVNDGTYGPPALIAPGPGHTQTRDGTRVVYVNTGAVAVVEVVRRGD